MTMKRILLTTARRYQLSMKTKTSSSARLHFPTRSTTLCRFRSDSSNNNNNNNNNEPISIPGAQTGGRKLAIIFTCNVCETRSAKQFTEQAYTKGVVIVRCPTCSNLHLIADRLGYFGDDDDFDVSKLAEVTSVQSIKDGDVLELSLEDLVGKEKMQEILKEAGEETTS